MRLLTAQTPQPGPDAPPGAGEATPEAEGMGSERPMQRPSPQPGSEGADLQRARRWRFGHAPETEARLGHAPQPEGVSGGALGGGVGWDGWERRSGEPPGWNVLGFLRRRKLRIGAVAAAAMACFTVVAFLLPPSYRAHSAVIYQGDQAIAIRDGALPREPAFAADTISNEVERLTSDELLRQVASALGLQDKPEFDPRRAGIVPAWLRRAFGALKADLRQFGARIGLGRGHEAAAAVEDDVLSKTVERLRGRLSVDPAGVSRVIRIAATSRDPDLAAAIANTVAESYVASRAAAKAAETREAHEWIGRRLDSLRDRALASAQAFDKLRHERGAVRGRDGTISQEQLTQVSAELTQARQVQSTLQAVLSQAAGDSEADLDLLTSASGSLLLPKLREQLSEASARGAELGATRGFSAPGMAASRAQVADIARSIERERSRIRQTLDGKLEVATASERRLSALLDAMKAKAEQSDGVGAEMQALERRAAADAETYRSFAAKAEQTDPELNYQPPSVQILSRAATPTGPASPNKTVILPAAFLLSLGLGGAAALLKETGRRGVVSLRGLPRPGGQTPLGVLPLMRRRTRKLGRAWDEAVEQILARMLLPAYGIIPASILVTSALPREGKTRAAIALAAAAAKQGLRVLLVDADLRRRSASKAAGLGRSDSNLVRLLRGEIALEEGPVYHTGWGFCVLAAGEPDISPMTLLSTSAWEGVLRDLESQFDLVIIDTPPVLAAGDAWVMARHADATAMLVEWGATQPATVGLALERLASARARLLGLTLTKVDPRDHATYGHDDAVLSSPKLLRYHSRRRLR